MKVLVVVALFSWTATAQSLPEGPGKDVVETICGLCHEAASAVIGKQWTRAEWDLKVVEMLQEEPDVTKEERATIIEYLSTHFRPGGKIYVNKAPASVLERAFQIPSQAAEAIVRYRDRNGNFKTLDDLKKVSGLDMTKVESKKELLVF